MRIGAKETRSWIPAIVIGLIPEIIISLIFAAAVGDRDFWTNSFLAFCGLHVVYFLVWAKKSIWDWIRFYFAKKTAAKNIQMMLRDSKFPMPPEYVSSVDEYMRGVMDNEENPLSVRVAAAELLGCSQGMVMAGGVQMALRMVMIEEIAITDYRNSFPPTP